jgi:hypothetical protein
MKSLFNNVVFATIIIAVAVVLFIAAVPSSKAKAEDAPVASQLTNNFGHVASETISDHETIEVYHDANNDAVCYLYRNSNRLSYSLSCIKK